MICAIAQSINIGPRTMGFPMGIYLSDLGLAADMNRHQLLSTLK